MKSTPGTHVPNQLLLLSARACCVAGVAMCLASSSSASAQQSKTKPAAAPGLAARSAQAQRLTFVPFKPLRTLYVSPRGSDASVEPTSIIRPLKIIGKAAGTAENPFVFQAYPGESVTISGADAVSGTAMRKG